MNPMRQRDELKKMCAAGVFKSTLLDVVLSAPVFLYKATHGDDFTDSEEQWMRDNIFEMHGESGFPKAYPFPAFRISYTDIPVFEQWVIGKTQCICVRCDDGYSHEKVVLWSMHLYTRYEQKMKMCAWANSIAIEDNGWAGKIQMIATEEERRVFANACLRWLGMFLFDVMSQSKVILKVTPNNPGRSVEWVKQRTHYLVLDGKHAQKCRDRKGGPTDHELVRAAHWRRAHLRRLSSDKFKHKKGLLVMVKRAWVGPEEWKGDDGKIYKVINMKS